MILFNLILADWFAGNGINVTTYDIHGQQYVTGCMTYDGCYMLFCYFLSDPSIILININVNKYDGDCLKLNPNDGRAMNAFIDCYHDNQFVVEYTINNVSYASQLLCILGKNKTMTEIDYLYISCDTL
ncbi:MAG TPA: hypothetical protein VLG50_07510 [Candidatus Saccharimonadales bacterium]|nr:hypothetical protein [Candidatus Saccharimonadales bacterium]